MLQRQFGIDRDVTLEFDSISLSVPINMSFASTSLSLAHIYAIATASASESKNEPVRSNISRMGQDSQLSASSDGSQILIASLVVESTNFVKKYNELVQNFQSKRSLNLTQSSQTVPVSHSESQNRKPTRRSSTSRARQMSESTGSDSMILDEVSSVESAKSTESVASSTWSRLAVRDTGSVAVLSDNESVYEDWDRTRQASTLFARSHRDFFLHDSSIPWIRSSEALSSTSLDPRDTPLFSSSPASSSPPTGNSPASNNRPNRFHFATSGTPSPNSVSKKRPRMNASSSLHSVPNMPYSVHNYEEGQISSKRPKYQSVPGEELET